MSKSLLLVLALTTASVHGFVAPSVPLQLRRCNTLAATRRTAPVAPIAKAAITAHPLKAFAAATLTTVAEVSAAAVQLITMIVAFVIGILKAICTPNVQPSLFVYEFKDWQRSRTLQSLRALLLRERVSAPEADADLEFVWRSE